MQQVCKRVLAMRGQECGPSQTHRSDKGRNCYLLDLALSACVAACAYAPKP